MPAWLKAGLIAGGFLFIVALISQVPILGCLTLPLIFVGYILAGVLAGMYTLPPRDAGKGAGQGALAGITAGVVGGLAQTIVAMIASSVMGTAQALSAVPPETLDQLRAVGIDPAMIVGPLGVGAVSMFCCGIGVFVAAALGAIGGAIYAAMRPN